MVPLCTFNINGTFPLHQWFSEVNKGSLDYKKNCLEKNVILRTERFYRECMKKHGISCMWFFLYFKSPALFSMQNQNAAQRLWCRSGQHIFSCPTTLYISSLTDGIQYFRPKSVSIDGWWREHASVRDTVLTGQPPQSCQIPLHPGELRCLFWAPSPSADNPNPLRVLWG